MAERTAQLQAANKELEAFSYSVSHDLRAPLRHMDGFLSMFEQSIGTGLDEKSRRYLTIISSASKKMGHLIEDLLAFSRMSRVALQKTVVDPNPMVQQVIEECKLDAAGRNIEWKVAPLPILYADPSLMRQVFTNLISNAVKYTRPREQARIEIGVKESAPLTIFIRDNGVGFDMKYVDKLFGVFQRLHGEKEFEGTGIGLANVHRIITRHGGRIWVEAEVNKGAAFFFELPPAPEKG